MQTWADTFISELNDTHIEADLRLRHTPPELDIAEVVRAYKSSKRRLIVLGYNATLTTAVEAPRQPKRHFDQIKALTRVNPRIMTCLEVCAGPLGAGKTPAGRVAQSSSMLMRLLLSASKHAHDVYCCYHLHQQLTCIAGCLSWVWLALYGAGPAGRQGCHSKT